MKLVIAAVILHAGLANAAEPACSALPISRIIPETVHGYINSPGAYCLGMDIRRVPVFDFHRGRMMPMGGQGLIQLACDARGVCPGEADRTGYDIDLQGHTIASEAPNMKGIDNGSGGLHVAVRNGRIEVPGDRIANIGIVLRGDPMVAAFQVDGKECWPTQPNCADIPAARADHQRGPEYRHSGHLVERMQVRAGFRGVQMGGGGNILRNSVIEVDSSTAAFLYGPGAIIENNTIIIHGKGTHGDFDAALKLRDAHGAIIRNNTFIYRRGVFAGARAAINLLDSRDVRIEGNTFKGFEQPVRAHGATTYTLK